MFPFSLPPGGVFCNQVVDVKADRVETVAVGGDPLLGGVDFDDALALHLANLYVKKSAAAAVFSFFFFFFKYRNI